MNLKERLRSLFVEGHPEAVRSVRIRLWVIIAAVIAIGAVVYRMVAR